LGTRILYLVRHGQYFTEEAHRQAGDLTPLGRRQAQRTGRRLANAKIESIYHSDMPRAAQSARIIAGELGTLPMHSLRALREMMPPLPKRRGSQPQSRKELAEVRAVATRLTKKFLSPPKGKKCRIELVVAHGNLIRYLIRLALKDPVLGWTRLGTHNCGVTLLAVHDRSQNYLIGYNDIGHLPRSMQTMM
jgi:broad specificity phosphatase PhoE